MRFTVTESDTAIALGSGDVQVLATPRLIAWLEAATVHEAAPLLAEGQTTVGTAIRVRHLRATPVDGTIEASAAVSSAEGRHLTFSVTAQDGNGDSAADGEIERVIVDRERFLAAAQD